MIALETLERYEEVSRLMEELADGPLKEALEQLSRAAAEMDPAEMKKLLDSHSITAEELRERLPRVGRATIYRSLKLLVEAGVLCRVLLEDGNLHYQLSHRGHHHHLLCVDCGASQDLLGCDIEDLLREVSTAHEFQLSGHWLEVYGRCRSCSHAAAAPA